MTTHRNPLTQERTSSAPYNFVPLPERVITLSTDDLPDALPNHDAYDPNRLSGFIDVELLTKTPLYIRSGVSLTKKPPQENGNEEKDKKTEWQLALAEKQGRSVNDFRDLVKNKPDFFYTHDKETPVIPGSSLRGMLRSLFEIVTYSKMQWVTKEHLFFRTVDNSSVGKHYRDRMVGKMEFGNKVEIGFLRKIGNRYFIFPCEMLRIPRELVLSESLRAFYEDFYDGRKPNLTPQWNKQYRRIWVRAGTRSYLVDELSLNEKAGFREAVMVLTGDAPRKKKEFIFLLPADESASIEVSEALLERFHSDDQITQWQEKAFPKDKPQNRDREKNGYVRSDPPDFGDPVFLSAGTRGRCGHADIFRQGH